MASCEVETSPFLAVEYSKSGHALAEHIRDMSGSNRVKVGRAHSYSIVTLTHSIAQREGIVASPPIGCSSHKNICNGKLQNRSKAQGLVKVILKKKGKQKENEINTKRDASVGIRTRDSRV